MEPDQVRSAIGMLWRFYIPSERVYSGQAALTANGEFGPEGLSKSVQFSPRFIEFMEMFGGGRVELREALRDLDGVVAEAQGEGFPIPSESALGNARRILLAMYEFSPQRFEIYPTQDGEVTIDAPGGRGRSLLVLCDSGGGALCLVNMNGRHRRARYSDADLLPDGFVREALAELAQPDELVA